MGSTGDAAAHEWFLTARERGNPATRIDTDHPDGLAWTRGNLARPLIHGSTYFAELCARIEATTAGDLIVLTDWKGNPDQQLTSDPDSQVVDVLGRAAERGVDVRVLVWRSQNGLLGFHLKEHEELGEQLQARGADVRLDMRVRRGGAHHQKYVVIRHRDDTSRDIAFVGGIDLCHGRRDDAGHHGDPQAEQIAEEYGDRPPWHDVQVALQGPAVRDVETAFRERWDDSTPSSRSPLRWVRDKVGGVAEERRPLPQQKAAPRQVDGANHAVQILRTYPRLGPGWAYDFAPSGERSVARGYLKAIARAHRLIYIEDQFLWGREMSRVLVEALNENPDLHVIVVLPQYPDVDGWFSRDPQILGRRRGIQQVLQAAPERVAVYGLENHAGTPVYVHAKVCVLDDVWASIGSDNFCRRSWTNDSELSAAVIDLDAPGDYARRLRLTLAAEHLDRDASADMDDCVDSAEMFARYAEAADALERWHEAGRVGERPAGRLRRMTVPELSWIRQLMAAPWYRFLHDPDGRPWTMRLRKKF